MFDKPNTTKLIRVLDIMTEIKTRTRKILLALEGVCGQNNPTYAASVLLLEVQDGYVQWNKYK